MKSVAEILKLIGPDKYQKISQLDNDKKITSAEWKLEACHSSSLAIYKLDGSEKSFTQLRERLAKAEIGLLFINHKIDFEISIGAVVVNDDNWLSVQKIICDFFYPLPSAKLVGITGTNGKTTTADLALQIAEQNKLKAISIGTLGVRSIQEGERVTLADDGLTTPPYLGLRKILHQHAHDKDVVFMEVSSHSLVQQRIYQIEFDSAAWTSFSQDHLDYHSTMENYFKAKGLIFSHLKKSAKLFVPKNEEKLVEKLKKYSSMQIAKTLQLRSLGPELPEFFSAYFNRNNLELALELVESVLGKAPVFNAGKLLLTEGRFTVLKFGKKTVIVDFAHTPEAIDNICQAIKRSFPGKKLVTVFGCGGNRDSKKRPLMGESADRNSDKVYVTSDNSRFEKPEDIIKDILPGITRHSPIVIVDRRQAIAKSFNELAADEILLLAGKGHESYLSINGVNYPFNDAEVVTEIAKSLGEF